MSEPVPEVSIVMPAYNAAAYLEEAVRSVCRQSFPRWELIIVDDCSRDGTQALCARLAAEDARVIPIRHEINKGPAGARQTAIDRARGRFIAFLDSDDSWHESKLARQLEFMRAHSAVLSFTQFRRVDASGQLVGRLIDVPDRLTYRDLLKHTAIATSTVMIDRDKSGPLKMTRTYYDDYALWLSVLKQGHAACGLREDMMRYRVLGGSVSRNKWKSARMVWRVYRDVERLSILQSAWCFAHYATRGLRKYATF